MNRTKKTVTALSLLFVLSQATLVLAQPQIENSVVKIVTQYNLFDWYTPWNSGSTSKGTGSGFVISKNRILTNAHVVHDAALLLVYFYNDPTPYPARLLSIGHDCDLAVLELKDPSRIRKAPALEFDGLPPLQSQVYTYGYPAGGNLLSTTAGVVSRIEIHSYVHSSQDQHLAIQTDAAINPGNSGGPVMQNNKVVGVAFQGIDQLENTGFFIPTEVVHHFLTDLEDGTYDGFPELGIHYASMDNPASREYAGMHSNESGVRVEHTVCGCSAEGLLMPGDIITTICNYDVANDGTIDWQGLRLPFQFAIDLLQKGDSVTLQYIRNPNREKLAFTLNHYNPNPFLANLYETKPKYYIYAGLVFAPLNRETLKTYGNQWSIKARAELLYEAFYRPLEEHDFFDTPHVIQIRKLNHAVNAEESRFLYNVVGSVNGKEISTLEDLVGAFENNTNQQHLIRFKYGNKLTVIDAKKGDAAHQNILTQYGIPKDRNL